eukprot:scaffold35262_cov206-Amphora_coffeaeformis.AAC.1
MLQSSSNNIDSSDDDSDDDDVAVLASAHKSPALGTAVSIKKKPAPSSNRETKEIIILDSDEPTVPTAASQPPVRPTRRSRRLRDKPSAGVAAPSAAPKRPHHKNNPPPQQHIRKDAEIEIFDSSSDEEDGHDAGEISPETTAAQQRLAQLQKARAQLEAQSTLDLLLDDDNIMIGTTNPSPRHNVLLHITVEASVDTNGAGLVTAQNIKLTLPAESLLQDLEQALLQQLKLPCNGSTKCYLRIGSKRLLPQRTAAFYELTSPVTIHASLYVTEYGDRPPKRPQPSWGPTLSLVLRHKNGTDKTISYGLKQPFKDLLDAHEGAILKFDGEQLSPDKTPASLGTSLYVCTRMPQ